MSKSIKVTVKGRVQGVGFRPFIFRIAEQYRICGTVQNNMDGVRIQAEGSQEELEAFVKAIRTEPPRLSRIDEVIVEKGQPTGFDRFEIIPSDRDGKSSLVIPVDSATCNDCLEEMGDPANFRYRYPFINCTQCGPRYTIIDALPYDRPYTVMKDFQMCDRCESEYNDPRNRRHHAQPIACDACGPEVTLTSIDGEFIAGKDEAIRTVSRLLSEGKIVAIKGLGGYHLACDAYNEETVRLLRKRKNRPNRPLAVMAANIDVAKAICDVSEQEEKIMRSPEAPIVILKKRDSQLAESLAPGMNTLGVMIPYTPLHHLLFDEKKVSVLVMTSANPSGLPLVYKDDEAHEYLTGIADYILSHNRKILRPVDDSVVRVLDGKLTFHRRARGYVPDPMVTGQPVHEVVALGSQQKNTFAIGRNRQIFVGPHIGDMEHLEVVDHFKKEYAYLMKWMGTEVKTVATDLHPGYMTTSMAEEMGARVILVQHHHAHLVSCMEDNRLTDPVFGIILDGTGYGEDGNIWGFEILYGSAHFYKRMAHLTYTHLPGGEKAIREPWRNATAMLIDYFGERGKEFAEKLFPDKSYEIGIINQMIRRNINSPLAGTCGRLFDAVSAILGQCQVSTYDGEAAIRLSEQMKADKLEKSYPFKINKNGDDVATIDFGDALLGIVEDRLQEKPVQTIIQKFHETIVSICVETVVSLSRENPDLNRRVVLSGGSFHNPYLLHEITKRLKEKQFDVYSHSRVPCNDGGLSLGQLIVAANRKEEATDS
ncbi:carbamoyltransferase HypF [Thermoactinomyces mirandus]|uniref:Carbamoyltransferase n=1 Tax=Thermoactinomyces mirandus TaxID=2756294 RepID=A0A7W2AQT4_9BACL|nr:carbamoyltransferase HypF [Thermoactinomyces mirandus]MBA4601823.1 carbamoyltransferase HypF [Thermoactinomyces mirandus]